MKKLLIVFVLIFFSFVSKGITAEILVKAIDSNDPQGYKRGMPVVVMDDGHVWGNGEQYPAFVVIKVPGVKKEEFAKYADILYDLKDSEKPVVILRREWMIQLNALPITSKGDVTVKTVKDWENTKPYIMNLRTGLSETMVIK